MLTQDFVLGYHSAAFQAGRVPLVNTFFSLEVVINGPIVIQILLHIVFSTKHRKPFIDADIEPELFKYLATACKTLDCPSHGIGGADDHIHISFSLSRTISVSKLIQELKQDSSKWIKTKHDRLAHFAWQNGYGAFSIGQSQLNDLRGYISGQREHHQYISFQDEFRPIGEKYGVQIDERYAWTDLSSQPASAHTASCPQIFL
jgi:putative transposase